MKEYHKIETLFERDMAGNKKLIEGRFRNPLVEYLKDNEWIFTEKIDGTNIRICWDGHKVTFQGRTDKAQLPADLVNRLTELFGGEINEELFEQKFGDSPVMLIGEGYGAGIQNGGDYKDKKDFILFDVMVGDVFLERENVENIAETFNLDVVPIMPVITIQEAVNYVKTKPISKVGKQEIEGVVGVPRVRITDFGGNRVIVKIKVKDFV
jgi:ATP-dependent RNA circularization protein (DNA/RNA ligase family)